MSIAISRIWLEFEEWSDAPSEQARDFFNMKIVLQDGREYALNVWTFDYIRSVQGELHQEQSGPIYVVGPDLIVEIADRPTLEAVAERLVQEEELREEWLVRAVTSPPLSRADG